MNTDKLHVELRKTITEDLETLFKFQLDSQSNYLAAFTCKDPFDKQSYLEKYSKLLQEPSVRNYSILVNSKVVGSIAKFEIGGKAELTYWIDRAFWGLGICHQALTELLRLELMRPIYGRTAFDNVPSQRLLEKAGFVKVGTDSGYANARKKIIEEFIYKLG